MTPVLMAVCLLAGLVVGLRWKHRRFLAERRRCGELEAKVDMYDRNALRTDHDVAGPVTPKPRFHDIDPDEPFDDAELLGPDQLAEMREQSDHVDLNRWAQGISHDPTVEHLGQACGWSEDGETDCGDPAEGWTRWPDGTVVWLCAGHYQWACHGVEDERTVVDPTQPCSCGAEYQRCLRHGVEDEPYQGPRSLPGGRRLD